MIGKVADHILVNQALALQGLTEVALEFLVVGNPPSCVGAAMAGRGHVLSHEYAGCDGFEAATPRPQGQLLEIRKTHPQGFKKLPFWKVEGEGSAAGMFAQFAHLPDPTCSHVGLGDQRLPL